MTQRLDEVFEGKPPLLDVSAVADLLQMTRQGVYGWIHSGKLPAYKIAGSWLISRDELYDLLAAGSNQIDLPDDKDSDESA